MLLASKIFFLLCLVPIIIILPRVFFAIYVYCDCINRGNDETVLWVLLTIFIPYYIGFIIYLIFRKNKKFVKCSKCGHRVSTESNYCPNCGNSELDSEPHKVYENPSKFLKIGIVFIIIEILVPVIMFASNYRFYNESQSINSGSNIVQDMDKRELKFKNSSEKYVLTVDSNSTDEIKINPNIKKGEIDVFAYVKGNKKAEYKLNEDSDELNINLKDFMDVSNGENITENDVSFILQMKDATGKIKINEINNSVKSN